MAEIEKCDTTTRKFCTDLDERLLPEQYNGGGKTPRGLAQVNVVNADSDEWPPRNVGVAYVKDHGDRGMFIRFCPFCGTDLRSMVRDTKSPACRVSP